MIWTDPQVHDEDCYFCINSVFGMSQKQKHKLEYTETKCGILPVPLLEKNNSGNEENDQISQFEFNNTVLMEVNIDLEYHRLSSERIEDDDEKDSSGSSSTDSDDSGECHALLSQKELNDTVRDIGLSKQKSELLASRLREKKCYKKVSTFLSIALEMFLGYNFFPNRKI